MVSVASNLPDNPHVEQSSHPLKLVSHAEQVSNGHSTRPVWRRLSEDGPRAEKDEVRIEVAQTATCFSVRLRP